jgi:hypothetical protein
MAPCSMSSLAIATWFSVIVQATATLPLHRGNIVEGERREDEIIAVGRQAADVAVRHQTIVPSGIAHPRLSEHLFRNVDAHDVEAQLPQEPG